MFNPHILLLILLAPVGVHLYSDSVTTSPASSVLDNGPHEDEKLGFKITTPKKWNQIPIQNDERWIVGRFQSNKANHFTDDTFGWTFDHKAEMTMIAFTGESMKTDIDLGDGKEEGEGRTVSTTLLIENPYKDYEEYLRKNYNDGGWYIDSEETMELLALKSPCFQSKWKKALD